MSMERGTRLSSPSDEEVGGSQGAIRARDVRAADLPKKMARTASTSPSGELCAGGADETPQDQS
jgi:hypothetical protein